MIKRTNYLNWLIKHRDKPIIKVVSGVRRSGKSTLFQLYRDYLHAQGVSENQILFINFEDLAFAELKDYQKLYQYLVAKLAPTGKTYIFLDEIQHVPSFELAIDSLFIKDNVDLYITGSNAYFMSGELATHLSGRYVELAILPLSLSEFIEGYQLVDQSPRTIDAYYELYLRSSFPYTAALSDASEILDYLRGIYSTVMLNDVVRRLSISDVNTLERLFTFALSSIGSPLSLTNIANNLSSVKLLTQDRQNTHTKTVEKYLCGLCDALILYEAKRYNIKGKKLLTTSKKYYVVDIGLRALLLPQSAGDSGHILENIVYLELLRRGYTVYVGALGELEVDFYAKAADGRVTYIQVSESILDESTREREFRPLRALKDSFEKIILTRDRGLGTMDETGIQVMNVLDWLMGE